MSKLDLQQLVDLNFARIHRAALIMSGNPWDAEDLAQETFLLAARKWDGFQGRSTPYTWLYGILLNLERRHRRRHGTWRRKLQALCERYEVGSQSTASAEQDVYAVEWKQGLWAKVAELPEGQRQALVLRFSEELRYEEIAEVLGCPLGTVKSRLHHGLLRLRQLLEAETNFIQDLPLPLIEDLKYAV